MGEIKKLDCWNLAQVALEKHGVNRLLLYGPPGTGKTRNASTIGVSSINDVFSITLTDETPATELRGHFVIKDNDFVWNHGVGVQAWLAGKRLVVNEVDKASGDMSSLLLALLDDASVARMTLPNGDSVTPADGFSVVATMNGKPEDLEEALRDRFATKINIDQVHPGAIEALPYNLQEAAKNSVGIDADRGISVRAWIAFNELMQSGASDEVAAQLVFSENWNEVLNSLKIASEKRTVKESMPPKVKAEGESTLEPIDELCSCDDCRKARGESVSADDDF